VVGFVGLSIWLPYDREQQIIQKIESWDGYVDSTTCGPEWLQRLVGENQMSEFKVFGRVSHVSLVG